MVEVETGGDTPTEISKSIGNYISHFADFWSKYFQYFDYVFCLGDRYEMFAAVTSGIPFGMKFIHIHGGETTLGAIDNIFRHSITISSQIHFTSTKQFSIRVKALVNSKKNVFSVGSLSLDGIQKYDLLCKTEFFNKWNVDFKTPTILVTVHPETVAFNSNEKYANILASVLLEYSNNNQVLITLPNSDTNGGLIRDVFFKQLKGRKNFFILENLGKQSYFSAMKHCSFMVGNTSSGIIEAASFNKYVINLGKRQEGRLTSSNVFNADFNQSHIRNFIKEIEKNNFIFKGKNIYFRKNVAKNIINILKSNEFNK
jgi:GDP/UDP-N,N'-diacetylbacillosamine 2-epimerase (hydrolysing)